MFILANKLVISPPGSLKKDEGPLFKAKYYFESDEEDGGVGCYLAEYCVSGGSTDVEVVKTDVNDV